ncbi:MAG TPA: peptide chain release factor N(5)-glutamine methyltransferase [Egibacteraceae bacterium]|nr:peptide chain release factor N(5)-glutamine methyltransferase [Egibacteraceae bacterium]
MTLPPTVGGAIAEVEARLAAAGVPSPRADAEWLARHVLRWSRAQLIAAAAERLPAAAADVLAELADRRAQREPLQLILGSVGFRHIEVLVRPGVFIPRPETELLAGEAIARLPAGGVVLEPCTGTGAVACSVAQEASPSRVVATDISPVAVALARENTDRLSLDVEVLDGDLLEPVPADLRGAVDVLVCNPPYIAAGEVSELATEVADWDPHDALVSGPTGQEVVSRLVAEASGWLRPGGWLLLEVADTRAAQTAALCESADLADTAIIQDLTGRDRIVAARAR